MRYEWNFRARLTPLLALALFSICSASARAVPIDYTFTLLVEEVGFAQPGAGVQVGNTFSGAFQLSDDSAALANGIYSFLPLNSWSVGIGSVFWDMNAPGSAFRGFRDGAYCGAPGTGFSNVNPGLIVSGGNVTGFCGGVFGQADRPFIDFNYINGPGRFSSITNSFGVAGSYRIDKTAVPEPASAGLWLLALLMALGASIRYASDVYAIRKSQS